MAIKIISATPGLTTTERILEVIYQHPQGITVDVLSERLNRPVSMINHCLKLLKDTQKIEGKLPENSKRWVYYPSKSPLCLPNFSPPYWN